MKPLTTVCDCNLRTGASGVLINQLCEKKERKEGRKGEGRKGKGKKEKKGEAIIVVFAHFHLFPPWSISSCQTFNI